MIRFEHDETFLLKNYLLLLLVIITVNCTYMEIPKIAVVEAQELVEGDTMVGASIGGNVVMFNNVSDEDPVSEVQYSIPEGAYSKHFLFDMYVPSEDRYNYYEINVTTREGNMDIRISPLAAGEKPDLPYDLTEYTENSNHGTLVFVIGAISLPLTARWNLISLPKFPNDTNLESVMSSLLGKYESVWTYDPTADGWLRYIVGGPDFLNTLYTMDAGKGYWIDITAEEGTVLYVIPKTPNSDPETAIQLSKGWNLVGYNLSEPQPIEDAMESIAGKYNSVWTYDSLEEEWKRYVVDGPDFLNNLNIMRPYEGYWIYATEDTDWNIPSN